MENYVVVARNCKEHATQIILLSGTVKFTILSNMQSHFFSFMPFNHINCVVLMHYASSLSHATHNNDSCSLDPFSERTKQTFYDLYVICTEVCACTVYTVDCMLRFWSNGDTSSFGSEISKTIYFERPNQTYATAISHSSHNDFVYRTRAMHFHQYYPFLCFAPDGEFFSIILSIHLLH